MPLALLLIGVVFLTASVRGTHTLLFDTLKDDFTGHNNFLYWGLALFIISAVGYYKPLKPLSTAFMLLVVIVLFLSNRGFFRKFMEQIGSTQNHPIAAGQFAGYTPGQGWQF
jgi:FtsH-binding integral membrane protein